MPALTLAVLALGVSGASPGTLPRVFRLDPKALERVRVRARSHDPELAAALARLREDAQGALEAGPFSVTTKTPVPPSGDRHDYMSQAPYWWRNPATPDGLPYVRRDGERNPEIRRISDRDNLGRLVSTMETLALAHYLLGGEGYADRAALLLRTWFLDAATRMNPHLEYGQAIPGLTPGRGIGIIETRGLVGLVDAVGLLGGSRAWTETDHRGLVAWFRDYLRWLRESGHGRDEAAATNNHGTWYDAQVASFALFTDQPELAKEVLEAARARRVAAQIERDGRQPRELQRTRSWSYSVMNLGGMVTLAALGEGCGVDLWGYESPDGRSIRRAIDWLVPFAEGRPWPHRQITPWSAGDLAAVLREAVLHRPDRRYERLLARMPPAADDRARLLHPATRR